MSGDVNGPLARPDLRARRVSHTEEQLVEAARALFLEQGYVPTTLAQVAQRAGLAARTVYVRFGTKAALFKRVVDTALAGDTPPTGVAHRRHAQDAMTAATLAERIEALADLALGIAHRAGALFDVAAQAEGLEPDLAADFQAGRAGSRNRCETFWRTAAADGLLADGRNPETLAVVTDLLVCADTVVHLRRTHDWSADAYHALITDTLTTLARPPA